jgi:hypothetical protein
MRIEFENGEQLWGPSGLEIGIKGFETDPSANDDSPTQVYIEIYEGVLQVHVWDGTSQDPQTIKIGSVKGRAHGAPAA